MPKSVRFLVTASERLGIGELELDLGPLPRGYPFVLRAEGSESSQSTPEQYTRALLTSLPEVQLRVLAVCATLPFPSAASIVAHATSVDRDAFEGAVGSLLARGLIERSPNGQLSLCGTLRVLFRDTSGLDAPDVLHSVLDALREHAHGAAWNPQRAAMVEPELGNLVWAVQRAYAAGRLHDLEPLRIALDDSLYRLDYWRLGAAVGELAFLAASGTGNRNEMAWAALYPTTRVLYHAEDFAAAERWCAVALAIFEAQNHHEGTIAARRYLGRVKWSQGDRGRARSLFSSALERAWWTPENRGQLGLMLGTMAAFEHSENNLDEAERLYRETLALYGPDGKPESIGPTYDALGRIALAREDADEALAYFQRARTMLQHVRWEEQRASVAFSFGLAHDQRRDFDSAVHELQTARGIFADLGAQAQVAAIDAALLRVQSREGRARH
jgi:tetratricopeptide (TPR) repeat protein